MFVGWYPDSILKCLYNINDQFFLDFLLYLPYRVVFNGIIVKWCIAFYCEVMPSSFPKTIISKFWRNISWSSLIRSFSINNYLCVWVYHTSNNTTIFLANESHLDGWFENFAQSACNRCGHDSLAIRTKLVWCCDFAKHQATKSKPFLLPLEVQPARGCQIWETFPYFCL